jgi:signal transduction histidine kinase
MSRPPWPLQRRLMLAFAGFSLLVVTVFGLYAMVFMYAVEDEFFETMLEQEAAQQLQHYGRSGQWTSPRDAWVQVHVDASSFPDELRALHASEPLRHEFPGKDGRHYHLKALRPPTASAPAWLVAEVSDQLVVRPMRNEVFLLLAGSAVAMLALALLAGYWLARRTTGPLSRLATLVDDMAPDNLRLDFSDAFRNDEVGLLARRLQALTRRIDDFLAREQEFTRDASHELRTPLTVIRSAAERLLSEPGLSSTGKQHVMHARQSAMQLEQTVVTLLSLSREETPLQSSPPTLVLPVLERVIVEQATLLDGKPVTVEVSVPADLYMPLSSAILHILFSNLVGNAFAHTDSGSVTMVVVDDRLRIVNSADGNDPVQRWESNRPFNKRQDSEGYGLGLSILRRLCERHGIDLRIEGTPSEAIASIGLGATGSS